MRICITIAIIFIYLGGLFRGMAPVAYYQLNQDYIVSFFCENKDKPELKCNGACHLMKQLRKANEDSNSSQMPTGIGVEVVDMSHAPTEVFQFIELHSSPQELVCRNEQLPPSRFIRLDTPPPEA